MGDVVTKDQAGTYVQIAHRLRIQRGPGKPDTESERPRDGVSRQYLDADAPTLITFHAGDRADVALLLANGAIEEKSITPVAKKGADGG